MKNLIKSLGVMILATVIVASVVYATTGSFTPPTGTTANYRTLGDIHAKLTNFALNPSATHSVSTTTSPAGSFFTLGDIYGLLTAENTRLVPDNIRSGVTIFGVTGNYTGGASETLTWSDQFNGNLSLPAYSRRLCWDNSHCTATTGLYNHVGRLLGAKEYCAYLSSDGINLDSVERNIWRLPTKMELLLAMTLYIADNQQGTAFPANSGFSPLISLGATKAIWTGEPDPTDPTNSVLTVTTTFGTAAEPYHMMKWGAAHVRCVR